MNRSPVLFIVLLFLMSSPSWAGEIRSESCPGDFCRVSTSSASISSGNSDSGLENEIKALKKELADLKKEIMGLKDLIESRFPLRSRSSAKPTRGKASIKGDPFIGKEEAPIILVEFTDYECPYCGRHVRTTLSKLKEIYVETGKIKYVIKDFPLPFHKQAKKAAEAAHCAGEEGKYWKMHDLLFRNQKRMQMVNLVEYAEQLKLEIAPFTQCLEEGRYAKEISADVAAGRANGVAGTPSFLLGKVNARGEVEGQMLEGAKSFNTFKAVIDALLKEGRAEKTGFRLPPE